LQTQTCPKGFIYGGVKCAGHGSLVTKKAFTVDYGYYENDGKKIIVTSGVGTWGAPIRIGTKSEIVEIIVNFEIPEAAKGKAE
ncbi:hypothetical protein D3Z55_21115, partial [Clostridiaceae bacterium]|nr:hypothetical protein [Clostridiaceae bacterium]